jgi:hypothetical protein
MKARRTMQKRVSLSFKNALDNAGNSLGVPGSPAPKRLI